MGNDLPKSKYNNDGRPIKKVSNDFFSLKIIVLIFIIGFVFLLIYFFDSVLNLNDGDFFNSALSYVKVGYYLITVGFPFFIIIFFAYMVQSIKKQYGNEINEAIKKSDDNNQIYFDDLEESEFDEEKADDLIRNANK